MMQTAQLLTVNFPGSYFTVFSEPCDLFFYFPAKRGFE
jgi:hypothetical protein